MVSQIAALPEVFAVTPYVIAPSPHFESYIETNPAAPIAPFSTSRAHNPFFVNQDVYRGTRDLLNLDYIQLQMGITGQGVRIVAIDTGIDHNHPEFARFLQDIYIPGEGYVRGIPGLQIFDDRHFPFWISDHGTMTFGAIAAVAPEADIWSIARHQGWFWGGMTPIGALEAAVYIEADIVYTWGWDPPHPFYAEAYATTTAILSGTMVVAAGHNRGPNHHTIMQPLSPLAINVGAGSAGADAPPLADIGIDGIMRISGRGPVLETYQIKPDIVALGHGGLAPVSDWDIVGGYRFFGTTSQAGPLTTGAVALLMQAFPNDPPEIIKARLMNSARPLTTFPTAAHNSNTVFAFGAGFIQPYFAINNDTLVTVVHDVPLTADRNAAWLPRTMSSLSFGSLQSMLPHNVNTIPGTITNESAVERTYTIEYFFTPNSQGGNPGDAATLTLSRNEITLLPGESGHFAATITVAGHVPAFTRPGTSEHFMQGPCSQGTFEGFILVRDIANPEPPVARLPFGLVNPYGNATTVNAFSLDFNLGGTDAEPTVPTSIGSININAGTNIMNFLTQHHPGFTQTYGGFNNLLHDGPTRAGRDFAGWYLDPSFTTPLTISTGIMTDTTLYARWTGPDIVSISNQSTRLNQGVASSTTFDVVTAYIPAGTAIALQGILPEGVTLEPATVDASNTTQITINTATETPRGSHTLTLSIASETKDFTLEIGWPIGYLPFRQYSVAAGGGHSLVVLPNGDLYAWGNNSHGQVGDGTTTNRYLPEQIINNASSVFAGMDHTLAIKADGTLWAWGRNQYGQLGDGTTQDRHAPVHIMDDVVSASAGSSFLSRSLAVTSDGSLYVWGQGYGATPVSIGGNVASVSHGGGHVMIVGQDGTLWGWGNNTSGQLGDGTTIYRPDPVFIMDDVQSVSAGFNYTMAVRTDGRLYAWGNNTSGQLGDQTTIDRHSPVHIMGDIATVSAENLNPFPHTMAITTSGDLLGWGSNTFGQLGSTQGQNTPILTNTIDISTGLNYTLAVKGDGSVWAWGANTHGRLGDGTTISRSYPVMIFEPTDTTGNGNASLSGAFTTINPHINVRIELRENNPVGSIVSYVIVRDEASSGLINFIFNNIEPGTYTLIFSRPGHTTFTLNNITVTAQDDDINLTQEGILRSDIPLFPGDVNGDGVVNHLDRIALQQAWMTNDIYADFNGDGVVNSLDLIILMQNWMAVSVVEAVGE